MGRGKAKVQAEREGPWRASKRKVRRGERETPCRSPIAVMGPLALEGRARGGGEGGAHSSLLLRDCVFKHPPKPAKSAIASVHGSV